MKYLLIGALLTTTVIGAQTRAADAQALNPNAATSISTQKAPLVAQPAALKPVSVNAGRSTKPYTTDQLNSILGTLQANPKAATPASKNSIDSLLQRFSGSNPKQPTIDPIDFFKPPALDGGVKIPLQ